MKTRILLLLLMSSLVVLLSSGCYTVLTDPYAVADLHDGDLAYVGERQGNGSRMIGDFDGRDEMDDFYRYPGVRGSYGGYGGGYGGYGGGYNSYGGYGPYSYGYDPYYQDSGGYYVPTGYELVSTRQLDELRAGTMSAATPVVDPEAAAAELQQREEEIWMKRVEPRIRQAPTPTARPATSTISAPRSAPSATPKASSTAPASKSTSTKKSARPKKTRR